MANESNSKDNFKQKQEEIEGLLYELEHMNLDGETIASLGYSNEEAYKTLLNDFLITDDEEILDKLADVMFKIYTSLQSHQELKKREDIQDKWKSIISFQTQSIKEFKIDQKKKLKHIQKGKQEVLTLDLHPRFEEINRKKMDNYYIQKMGQKNEVKTLEEVLKNISIQ